MTALLKFMTKLLVRLVRPFVGRGGLNAWSYR